MKILVTKITILIIILLEVYKTYDFYGYTGVPLKLKSRGFCFVNQTVYFFLNCLKHEKEKDNLKEKIQ